MIHFKFAFPIFLTLSIAHFSLAQNNVITYDQLDPNKDGVLRMQEIQEFSSGDVRGTPFLFEDWKKGKIFFENNKQTEEVLLKYNITDNKIFIKKNQSSYIYHLGLERVENITLQINNSHKTRYVKIPANRFDKPMEDDFLYQTLSPEGERFLKFTKKTFKKASYKGPHTPGNPYDEYIEAKEYYLLNANGTFEKIKLKKKSIIKAMGAKHENFIENFCKENKSKLKDEQSVVDLLMKMEASTEDDPKDH